MTNALVLVGQHGVYCTSQRNPTLPAMDIRMIAQELDARQGIACNLLWKKFEETARSSQSRDIGYLMLRNGFALPLLPMVVVRAVSWDRRTVSSGSVPLEFRDQRIHDFFHRAAPQIGSADAAGKKRVTGEKLRSRDGHFAGVRRHKETRTARRVARRMNHLRL